MSDDFWTNFARVLVIAAGAIDSTEYDHRRDEEKKAPEYREVFPLIENLTWDHEKSEKGAKAFAANKRVKLDDLISCLKCFDWDSGRADLCKSLRGPIRKMSYFDRQELAECFDWESGTPDFLND